METAHATTRSARTADLTHHTLLVLIALFALPAHAERFHSARCKISFELPRGWVVKQIPADFGENCALGLRPPNWQPEEKSEDRRWFGEFAITIRMHNRPFKISARKALFDRTEEGWFLNGRMASRHKATWIHTDHFFGVKGMTHAGYHRREGGYQGLDDIYRSVLSNGKWRTATIHTTNPMTGKEFETITMSLRFE